MQLLLHFVSGQMEKNVYSKCSQMKKELIFVLLYPRYPNIGRSSMWLK